MQAVVIIPTYNEADNIVKMIPAVLAQGSGIHVLVVDDNSPDGTGRIVARIMRTNKRVHLVTNPKKAGIGPAYIRGFREAFALKPEFIVQIDADFSHDPAMIPELIKAAKGCDLVIGSRYCDGISVIRWPLMRLVMSYGAGYYIRFVLGIHVEDPTGGFKCFRRETLERMDLDAVMSAGYSFQIEMNYAFEKNGFRVREVPIVFTERTVGKSKMSRNIFVEAVVRVLRLRLFDHRRYFPRTKR
ncbi:MAG: polyprenol monophosphomannose synthase [Spirochaetota bacterium]